MTIKLHSGVNLTVIPTEKFKTIRIVIRFSAKHNKKAAAKRTLLSSLLETNSLHYPTQTAISEKLADLYGASFGLNVGKKGNIHQVNLMMSVVNGKYINDSELFVQAVDFIEEILFYPNIKNTSFEETTFQREKKNMMAYLDSLKEDKQILASLALQQLYFADSADQKIPSFGQKEDLLELSAADLAETYDKMLTEDQIDIFVLGDIDPEQVTDVLQKLAFVDRPPLKIDMIYRQALKTKLQEAELVDDVVQAKLDLAYQTPVSYTTSDRFALMVFNGLFGGFPHSKLFMNVREKASLAYYASSSFDSFRGLVTVQTGIDGKNRERVLTLIKEQLASLVAGDFTQEELEQTKVMLKNQYLLSLDNSRSLIEKAYLDQWLPQSVISDEDFLSKIMTVSAADVKKIAADLQLQAIFTIDKEAHHA